MPLKTTMEHKSYADRSPDDDTHSRASTLNGDEHDLDFPEKTPTPFSRSVKPDHQIPYFTGAEPTVWKSPIDPNARVKPDNATPYFTGIEPPVWKAPVTVSHVKSDKEIAYFTGIEPPKWKSPDGDDDDTVSQSSTLKGDDNETDFPGKPPVGPKRVFADNEIAYYTGAAPASYGKAPAASAAAMSGSVESQLAAIMSKLVSIEHKAPVASAPAEDYEEMARELKALKQEKKQWQQRHEAIWALRDEDVANNIMVRGMLAKARRELEGMTKLRDEDLANVQALRIKLADATRQLDKQPGSRRSSPSRNGRPASIVMERRNTADLFAVAQAAALQQRALELEKRNGDLVSQIEVLKGSANIDDLNRMTAHEAWKETVSDLEAKVKAKDAEIVRLKRSSSIAPPIAPQAAPASGADWHRIEALHDEHANYRERMGAKVQALRSEKEGLQRELNRKEDDCSELEARIQTLQRRMSIR
jgi:hypothetical protein